jgi:hypothetical protein
MFPRPFMIVALALTACGGASGSGPDPQGRIEETPAPKTEAVLAGPLCQGDGCQCKQADGDAGQPAAGSKRFEVRMGPSDDPLWVTIDGMVLFKNRNLSDVCFYVDLTPGEHKVTARGQAEQGLNMGINISEQGGADGTWWYRTFDFNCGAPGECDRQQIEDWKTETTSLLGKHDPCGSVKVQSIEWETGRMPDRNHPDDLLLRFVLKVYEFAPKQPTGSAGCDKGAAPAAADPAAAPAADPAVTP